MGQFTIRHLREKKGRFYWEPSASLKKLGFSAIPLGKNINHAIKKAEQWNREADRIRQEEAQPGPVYGTISWVVSRYYKSSRFTSLRERTQRGYIQNIKMIQKFAGDKHPSKLKPKLLERWYDKMRERTPATANAVIRVLSIIMEYAILEELIPDNPVKKIKRTSVPPRQAVWDNHLIDRIISKSIERKYFSMALALRLAADTGQRQGDILSLKWEQYDGKSLNFRQSKTGELVTVAVTPTLKNMIDRARKKRTSPYMLVSEDTRKPYKGDHFRHLFSEIRRLAEIDNKLQYRDLRRTAVVRLALSGATIAEIVSVTGHTLASATNILSVYLPKHTKMASHGISKLIDFEAAKNVGELEL